MMDWIGLTLKIIYHIIKYRSDPERMERAIDKDLLDSHFKGIEHADESLENKDPDELAKAVSDLRRALLHDRMQNTDRG